MKKSSYSEKFAQRLIELMQGKSINAVAKEIGIPQQTLWRYIHCEREIGMENLCKIADYFAVDLDYLVGRKDY